MANSTHPVFNPPKSRRLVSAWIVPGSADGALRRVREHADLFDQIILMTGGIQEDGSLPDRWPAEERRRVVDELRELGISCLIDYGGRLPGQAIGPMRDGNWVDRVVRALVEDCERTGADGVDIDIEHCPAEARYAYTDLIAALGEALHARDRMLSICLYPQTREARREMGMGFIDPTVLTPWVDHFRFMVYDQFCPPSQFVGPTSTADWGREAMRYVVDRLPCEKVVMGLPTYSVDWDMTDPSRSRQVNDAAFVAAREAESPIGRGWCFFWDVGLIRYTDDQGHPHLLWLSDARSTKSHLVTVDSLDLAGVCFWLLTGEEDGRIWDAVRNHFARS